MRFAILVWLVALVAIALAYTPEDLEIFDVQSQIVEGSHKEDYDFYKFLRLPNGPSSTSDEIEKQYKKLSRKWHPDKYRDAKTKKKATARFEKLSGIVSILRDHTKRQRYDYYLKHGFPKYNRETGGYTFGHRFKPSFVLTLVILIIIVSVLQYIVMYLNRDRRIKRADNLIESVRSKSIEESDPTDFGPKVVPYLSKLFVVEPDRSVWLVDEPLDTADEIRDVTKRLNYQLNAETVSTEKENRKQRRAKKKEKEKGEKPVALLQVKSDEPPLDPTQLFIFKLIIKPFSYIKGFISGFTKKPSVEPTPKETIEKVDLDQSEIRLPNGKIVRKRK